MIYGSGTAQPLYEADNDYARSFRSNSAPVTDSEASPLESEGLSLDDYTKTSCSTHVPGDKLPDTIITEWTVDECADFVGSLGLRQYSDQFLGSPCSNMPVKDQN